MASALQSGKHSSMPRSPKKHWAVSGLHCLSVSGCSDGVNHHMLMRTRKPSEIWVGQSQLSWSVCAQSGEKREEWKSELTVTKWVKSVLKMLRNDSLFNCIVVWNQKSLVNPNLILLLAMPVRSHCASAGRKASHGVYEPRALHNYAQHWKIPALGGHKWGQSIGLIRQIKICGSGKIVFFYGAHDIPASCICHDIMILLTEKKWKVRGRHSCYLSPQ